MAAPSIIDKIEPLEPLARPEPLTKKNHPKIEAEYAQREKDAIYRVASNKRQGVRRL